MLISATEQFENRKYILNTSLVAYLSIDLKVVKKMHDKELFGKSFTEPKLIKETFYLLSLINSF